MIHANGKHPHAKRVRPFELVLLAGALNPSPLRRQLDIPAFSLPVTSELRMIDLWLNVARRQPNCCGVRIVVSSSDDVRRAQQAIESHLSSANSVMIESPPSIDVLIDPNDYRGPAGLIRDIGMNVGLPEDAVMVVGEVSSLAPPTLVPLFAELDADVAGLVGASETCEPAGIYVFTPRAIETIPTVGFQDIKEQLLPRLYQRGMNVRMACVTPQTRRIRDRESYLSTVWHVNRQFGNGTEAQGQNVSGSAHVSATCLIQADVTIEDGAIIHDSIVMEGAKIGGGAVVSRSIVAPNGIIKPREVVRSTIVTTAPKQPGTAADTLSRQQFVKHQLVTHVGFGTKGG